MGIGLAMASLIAAGVGAAGTAGTMVAQADASRKQRHAQDQAMASAKTAAAKAKRNRDIAFNKANRQTADASAMLSKQGQRASGGISSTMLTGPSGVSNKSLSLGKNTLLGS